MICTERANTTYSHRTIVKKFSKQCKFQLMIYSFFMGGRRRRRRRRSAIIIKIMIIFNSDRSNDFRLPNSSNCSPVMHRDARRPPSAPRQSTDFAARHRRRLHAPKFVLVLMGVKGPAFLPTNILRLLWARRRWRSAPQLEVICTGYIYRL